MYCLFVAGCLHRQVLIANGDAHAFSDRDETELDDTELRGRFDQLFLVNHFVFHYFCIFEYYIVLVIMFCLKLMCGSRSNQS